MQVRELEHELEAVLFERSGPRISLSPAGEQLFAIAGPLVEAMDGLPDVVTGQLGDFISDELRLAAGPGAVAFVLPPYLRRFRDENPTVRLRVSTRRVGEALKLLGANEVDLAVGAERFGTEDCIYYPAFSYELVLITSLDHPLAGRESVDVREAGRYPAVVPHAGTYARRFGEGLAREHGVELDIAVEASGWGVLKAYVEIGLGDFGRPGHLRPGARPALGHPVARIRRAPELRVLRPAWPSPGARGRAPHRDGGPGPPSRLLTRNRRLRASSRERPRIATRPNLGCPCTARPAFAALPFFQDPMPPQNRRGKTRWRIGRST